MEKAHFTGYREKKFYKSKIHPCLMLSRFRLRSPYGCSLDGGVTIPHTLAYIIGLQKNLFASPCVFSNRKRHSITY